ncbi:MAG: hypothetical protein ROY99_01750 [Ignavibacterium sp.]|jgi:hypothetical protein|nr:hypothetical protein [Ignavibacterium sp.]
MTKVKDLIYTIALSELRAGEQASKIGNIGQARVCARRACGMAIEYWLKSNSDKDWGASAITMLNKLQEDCSIPKNIREAAFRLTKKVDRNFETGIEEDPLIDGEMIVKYFLDSLQTNE